MIVLCFGMQREDIFERTNWQCHVFTSGIQEEDILKQTNGKCHLYTLSSTCGPLCNIGIMSKHTVSTHDKHVSNGCLTCVTQFFLSYVHGESTNLSQWSICKHQSLMQDNC